MMKWCGLPFVPLLPYFDTTVLWKLAFCAAQPAQPPWNRDRRLLYVQLFETRRKSVSCPGLERRARPAWESFSTSANPNVNDSSRVPLRNRSSHCRTLERTERVCSGMPLMIYASVRQFEFKIADVSSFESLADGSEIFIVVPCSNHSTPPIRQRLLYSLGG